MDKISFLIKSNITYDVNITSSANTIMLTFENSIPDTLTLLSGFNVLNEHNGANMSGTSYHKYNTLYRVVDEKTIILSNDGSVFEGNTDNEIVQTTTLDAIKRAKCGTISIDYSKKLENGIDIILSESTIHFSFSSDDVPTLLNKSLELQATSVEYVDFNGSLYSKNDMQTIISNALYFINKETAYKNNLLEYINALTECTDVEGVSYGQDIPSEYITALFSSYLNGEITLENMVTTRVDNLEENMTTINSELGNTQLAIAELYELMFG